MEFFVSRWNCYLHQRGRLLASAAMLYQDHMGWLSCFDCGVDEIQAAGEDRCTSMRLKYDNVELRKNHLSNRTPGIDRRALPTGHFTKLTIVSDHGCWFRTASPSLSTLTFGRTNSSVPKTKRNRGQLHRMVFV